MKRLIKIMVLYLFAIPMCGQNDLTEKFIHFDFSPLITENDENILGFIGDNFERIKIKYISITKDTLIESEYFVEGKSKVKSNVCTFQGKIKIFKIDRIAKNEEYIKLALEHGDTEMAERYSKDEYVLYARYEFNEDPRQAGSGIFEGVLKSNFYLENGRVHYDNMDLGTSDSFSNNQCTGTWTSHKTRASKTCNWGEHRIPDSGDLDYGAGEFSPNHIYLKNGWQEYYDAYFLNKQEARINEKKKWW